MSLTLRYLSNLQNIVTRKVLNKTKNVGWGVKVKHMHLQTQKYWNRLTYSFQQKPYFTQFEVGNGYHFGQFFDPGGGPFRFSSSLPCTENWKAFRPELNFCWIFQQWLDCCQSRSTCKNKGFMVFHLFRDNHIEFFSRINLQHSGSFKRAALIEFWEGLGHFVWGFLGQTFSFFEARGHLDHGERVFESFASTFIFKGVMRWKKKFGLMNRVGVRNIEFRPRNIFGCLLNQNFFSCSLETLAASASFWMAASPCRL